MSVRTRSQSRSRVPTVADDALANFDAAYDRLIARWAVPVERIEVAGRFGTTRVNACGPPDAPPLVVPHGGGTNSAIWYANAAALAGIRRVYAPDVIGDPGHSRNTGQAVRTRQDLLDWLADLLAALDIRCADLCGHSFGAWLALAHTLRAQRGSGSGSVGRLALFDPTQCFTGFSPACLWHALPSMLRPARGDDSYLRWETRGAELHPDWLALHRLSAAVPTRKIIAGRKPNPGALQALHLPVLVLVAEHSRAHDVETIADRASRTLPHVTVDVLPGVSHHMIPFTRPEALNERLIKFFTDDADAST